MCLSYFTILRACRFNGRNSGVLTKRLITCGLMLLLVVVVSFFGGEGAIADSTSATAINSYDSVPVPPHLPLGVEASDISSEKISQFARAYIEVVDLIERRESELQSAETESESRRIQHDIEAEAFTLIEEAGLTRQEYLQLLGLANLDPEFGERIATQIDEIQEK